MEKINKNAQRVIRSNNFSIGLATVILIIIFRLINSNFLSAYNIFSVSRTASLYLFIALAQVLVLVIGGMNLSLGAIGSLCVITLGYCMEVLHFPTILAILATLFIGGVCGLINGFIIIKLKLNSFIVTLATSFVYSGLVTGLSKGFPFSGIYASFTNIGKGSFLMLPYLFWLMVLFLVLLGYFFRFTVFGRRLLATGSNEPAARLSGIRTQQMMLAGNILSGVFAGLAAALWVSRLGSASPATGEDWMMISFAVAAIGGTSLQGGRVSCVGLFIGAFIIALIKNGLIMIGVDMYYEETFLGLLILLAVCLETIRSTLMKRKMFV